MWYWPISPSLLVTVHRMFAFLLNTSLTSFLGSQGVLFLPGGMAKTTLNLKLQIPYHFGILMPVAQQTTKNITILLEQWAQKPRLLLHNWGMERYIGMQDSNLCLLVFSCLIITAHGQLQQPIPDKSKTIKSSDPSRMRVSVWITQPDTQTTLNKVLKEI